MIDSTAMLVRHLMLDPAVSGKVSNHVAGERVPADWTPPFVLVNSSMVLPASWPAPTWWSVLAQCDSYADTNALAFDLAVEVQRAVIELIGTSQPEAVVQEAYPSGFQQLDDPLLEVPRVICSFTITARRP
jgi:hypothetical protein